MDTNDSIDLGREVLFSRSLVEGLIAQMRKDEAGARSAFVAARVEQQKIVQAQPNDSQALSALGLIDAALGGRKMRCAKVDARSSFSPCKRMHWMESVGW